LIIDHIVAGINVQNAMEKIPKIFNKKEMENLFVNQPKDKNEKNNPYGLFFV
jgi:hypothetical protein